jgi:hypothetical protein
MFTKIYKLQAQRRKNEKNRALLSSKSNLGYKTTDLSLLVTFNHRFQNLDT